MNRKYGILLLMVLVVGYSGIKWLRHGKNATVPTASILSVTVVTPAKKTLHDRISVTGMTIPREEVLVSTELTDIRVQALLADVGDTVKKGQTLALLDGESLRHQLTQLQSDYDRAYDEFKRLAAIKNTGAVSQELVTQKRTALQSAQAKLEDAKLNLKRSVIVAPIDGVIFERKAVMGARINANEVLYRLARHGDIEFEANVPEATVHTLIPGQRVVLSLNGRTKPITGKIRLITPRIDSTSRTAAIRITLDHGFIPVGLFGDAEISIREIHGMVLPSQALQQDGGGSYVWQINAENTAVRLPVTVTFRSNESIVIKDIAGDAKIVARAGSFLNEGERVNIIKGP